MALTPLKKLLIILLIGLVMIIFSYFFLGIDIIEKIKKNYQQETRVSALNDEYCIENIVPDKFVFSLQKYERDNQIYGFKSIASDWKDGTKVDSFGIGTKWIDKCEFGKELNENKDYIYCKRLKYSKIVVENDELIIYRVDLALDNKTIEESKPQGLLGYADTTFDIVNYKCYRVWDDF